MKPVIAFDVDCTLIDEADQPRPDIIGMLVTLERYCRIVVWSGCGRDYAEMIGRRLGLPDSVTYQPKPGPSTCYTWPDITFDDVRGVKLGTVNIYVGEKFQ